MKTKEELISEVTNFSDVYDEEYFKTYCDCSQTGLKYSYEEKHFVDFFDRVADQLITIFNPKTVLDIGCAIGLLVWQLRNKGIEAYGFDISEYAINQVHESIKDYCYTKSLIDNPSGNYDLVTCIEVLEHFPSRYNELMIKNICSYGDLLVVSCPFTDDDNPTHINVQSREYWINLFNSNGFNLDDSIVVDSINDRVMIYRRI